MKLLAVARVTGFTQFAGVIDGDSIDANTVFIEVDIDAKSGKGTRTAGRKCVDASVLERIKSIPLPFEAELELLETASRGKERTEVVHIKPRGMAKAAA